MERTLTSKLTTVMPAGMRGLDPAYRNTQRKRLRKRMYIMNRFYVTVTITLPELEGKVPINETLFKAVRSIDEVKHPSVSHNGLDILVLSGVIEAPTRGQAVDIFMDGLVKVLPTAIKLSPDDLYDALGYSDTKVIPLAPEKENT